MVKENIRLCTLAAAVYVQKYGPAILINLTVLPVKLIDFGAPQEEVNSLLALDLPPTPSPTLSPQERGRKPPYSVLGTATF